MTEWKFELTVSSTTTEVDEPNGFKDIAFNIIRDDIWHGINIEATSTPLQFRGAAYTIIKGQKESYGVDALVVFTASVRCEGETLYTEAISGKLNFANYKESCGSECYASLAVEQNNCAMIFKNRFDQKVDIDSPVSFNKTTLLQPYTGIALNVPLATQVIPISADADVDVDVINLTDLSFFYNGNLVNHQNLLVRPTYSIVNDNSILTGYLDNPLNVFQPPGDDFLLTPQVLLEENPGCIQSTFSYDIRLKGNIEMIVTDVLQNNFLSFWACVDYWNGSGTHYGPGQSNGVGNAVELERVQFGPTINPFQNTYNIPFDESFTGVAGLPVGYGLYAYIKVLHVFGDITQGNFVTANFNITFDPETSFLLTNSRECPPTDCDAYLINETLSRVTESITDRCLTVESEYYGRTDSEPYDQTFDGCGSLRMFTSGLKIRQATDKKFFASMKELMMGLRAIDNIGWGLFGTRIRIEPAEYFYQNIPILSLLLIPKSEYAIDDRLVYSNIKTGYNKWEVKSIKGIDEFNSYKERRTSIESISNELDITTDLIASGYIIENYRTQTLVNTGNTDNTYDNDVFIICLVRGGYDFIVEQNIADTTSNFYSPATAYNWRIRPLYNVMRWFKSIAQSYVNLVNTTSKLFFTSGKGNYLAEGKITATLCRQENKALAENDDIATTDFQTTADGTPIFRPETISFEFPLSIADYKLIKANPYGYINVQCGTSTAVKAFIKTIEYSPATTMAKFELIRKWTL